MHKGVYFSSDFTVLDTDEKFTDAEAQNTNLLSNVHVE